MTTPEPELLQAAELETQPLVRRHFVSRVVSDGAAAVEATLRARLDPAALSLAVEESGRTELDPQLIARLPKRLQLLATLNGPDWEDDLVAGLPAPLAHAFRDDDDALLAVAVGNVSERELRRAIAALSPFDDDGLGAWYWLESIDRIDELFLSCVAPPSWRQEGSRRPPRAAIARDCADRAQP